MFVLERFREQLEQKRPLGGSQVDLQFRHGLPPSKQNARRRHLACATIALQCAFREQTAADGETSCTIGHRRSQQIVANSMPFRSNWLEWSRLAEWVKPTRGSRVDQMNSSTKMASIDRAPCR